MHSDAVNCSAKNFYSVLQCVTMLWMRLVFIPQSDAECCSVLQCGAVYCSVLQCFAVRYSVVDAPWLYSAIQRSVMQCVVVCYSVLPCVAVCCSVLQCVTVLLMHLGFIPQQPQHLSLYTRDRQLGRDATTLAHGLPHVYKHLSKTKEPAKSCGKKQPHLHTLTLWKETAPPSHLLPESPFKNSLAPSANC